MNIADTDFEVGYKQIADVSKDKEIIVFCGGYACTKSAIVADLLMKKGHKNVKVYNAGEPEWSKKDFVICCNERPIVWKTTRSVDPFEEEERTTSFALAGSVISSVPEVMVISRSFEMVLGILKLKGAKKILAPFDGSTMVLKNPFEKSMKPSVFLYAMTEGVLVGICTVVLLENVPPCAETVTVSVLSRGSAVKVRAFLFVPDCRERAWSLCSHIS